LEEEGGREMFITPKPIACRLAAGLRLTREVKRLGSSLSKFVEGEKARRRCASGGSFRVE